MHEPHTMAAPARVMLVDDHPMWLATLRVMLERLGAGTVVAECTDGGQALTLAEDADVDVIVMDVDMPLLGGIAATRALLAADPSRRVLVLSGHVDRDTIAEAVAAGASGYLVKTSGPTEVADAIARVRRGELVFPDEAAAVVRAALRGGATTRPDRTVTLLLTDIEGSTGHAVEVGDRWPDMLVQHRRVVRGTCSHFGGVDHGGRGDECVQSFGSARDAVRAAVACQRALAATDWRPLRRPVRVRIGIHTGEPLVTPEGLEGIDFHRAARVRDAGNGGVILLSDVTARMVAGMQLPDAQLVDVGELSLAGLAAPERLTRVAVHDLPGGPWRRGGVGERPTARRADHQLAVPPGAVPSS